jgi:release factor glutamine methyltransferase
LTPDPFRPTEYTAALLLQLRRRAGRVQGRSVLELGTGSGVVLAAMLDLGAATALGVELEPAAVECTKQLLKAQRLDSRGRVVQGNLWAPCAGQRFDVIVTNLPQFPLLHPLADGRLPSWSSGGTDGRALVDRFIAGLPAHLAAGAWALMTHNVFCDVELSRRQLHAQGLATAVVATVSLPLPRHKLAGLPPAVLAAFLGRGLHRVGEFTFADFHVLEITARAVAPG